MCLLRVLHGFALQDWLYNEFNDVPLLTQNISMARTWLLQMGSAAEKNNLTIQYAPLCLCVSVSVCTRVCISLCELICRATVGC